jgi:hypothetical protein
MATFSEIEQQSAVAQAQELLAAAGDRDQLGALIGFDRDDPYLHSAAFGYAVAMIRRLLESRP